MKYTAEDILISREKRVIFQNLLMDKLDKPLLVMRVNYPGVDKNNSLTENIMIVIDKIVSNILDYKVCYRIFRYSAEGPMVTMAIDEDPYEIKKLAIEIEDKHTLGRCIDMDVYTKPYRSISRVELGYSPRKCFICNDTSYNCVRSRKHSEQEIIRYITEKYKGYIENIK